LKPLAEAGVPLFSIHGDSDLLVPLDANSGELNQGTSRLVEKWNWLFLPDRGHSMWNGFFQSRELVEFVISHLKK
jgi:pimeloyl-ACP methyl ester carboxylesterase